MKYRLITLTPHGDNRGQLIDIEEFSKDFDFSIRRVYYIYMTKKDVRRGFHSHLSLKQLLICTSGSCCIHVDDEVSTKEYTLDDPAKGLIIEDNVWGEMYSFSENFVFMVIASERYNEKRLYPRL